MLKVEHLFVSFTKEFYTLNDINFELKKSERLIIIGSKESGRTVCLRTLLGLEPRAKGDIFYKNISIDKIDFQNDISVAYLPVNCAFLENKTVKQNIEYVLKIRNKEDGYLGIKVNNALIEYGIDYIKNKKVKELNYLERLKLALARFSVRNIDIFLIDDIFEKLSSLELNKIIKMIKQLIKSNDASALIMTEKEEIADSFGYNKKYLVYGSLQDTL